MSFGAVDLGVRLGSAGLDVRPVLMTRRRWALAVALVLLALVLGVVLMLVRGGGEPGVSAPPPRAPKAIEPLAFMPAGTSAVVDFDTGQTTAALAAIALVSQLPGASLTAEQVEPLTGGRMAVAFGGGRVWLAAQTRSAPPRPSSGAVAAARGGTVVVAPSGQALQAALGWGGCEGADRACRV